MAMLNYLQNEFNTTTTTNGAFAYKSTKSDVLDLFATGGAYRNRSESEVLSLFSKAFAENPPLAMKTLFYLRDREQGQGERRFFRLALQHLATHHPEALKKNIALVPTFGRWDDLWVLLKTDVRYTIINVVYNQFIEDLHSDTPSLLAKWMPSENASSQTTKEYAKILRKGLGLSSKQYRKALTLLREKIKIVETLLTEKRYDEIEYDKLPSRAGMKYRGAFIRNDNVRYSEFINSLSVGEKSINSSMLYPYEIVGKALGSRYSWETPTSDEIKLLDGMWNNLPDFVSEDSDNAIAVVDVSGSMEGRPMEVAISLGLYLAERAVGPYQNHFFTFSARPQLVSVKGDNLYEKVLNMEREDWGMSTDIEATLMKILDVAVKNNLNPADMVGKLVIISDMQFNQSTRGANQHLFDGISVQFELHGYKMPEIVFWNVNAQTTAFPYTMNDSGVRLVSGFSPTIFQSVLSGKFTDPYEYMLEVVNSERYSNVTV